MEFHPGGKYVHPHHAGTGGSYLRDEERLVFWEGRSDFHRISLQALIHPTHGDYSFLLAHGVQSTMFVQALTCSKTTGARVCNMPGTNDGANLYPEGTEAVFHTDTVASTASFDPNDASQMTEATDRIGLVLLYNDGTRPGWSYWDDDGSFIIKHKKKAMILVSEKGGGRGDANRIQDGYRLVWKACPTNCANDFSREEYLTYGFVFEDYQGRVCLPPGV